MNHPQLGVDCPKQVVAKLHPNDSIGQTEIFMAFLQELMLLLRSQSISLTTVDI